jgi:hypothetical protein
MMSTTKQNNPNIDFGFHAVIPRIVRTHYPELSPLQKWFYACLKDLCGDHGTCYRTVRVLSQETGLSTGMVSESIPALHKAGLIHAEKKRRTSGGKEVWHITIVDIWKANGEAHPTKRSQNEQECSQNEQTQVNVHHMNKNVHTVNDNTPECSPHEQECSHSETEVITLSNNNIEAITVKQESVIVATANADVVTTAHTSLSEKKEEQEIPPSTPTEEQGVTPSTKKGNAARRSPASGKNKRSKKNETADLLALSEIPAPQKPDPATHPYNVELFMKLADYYRGCELAESPNPNSRYQKALKAAIAFVQRKTPFEHVDKLFCFMTGRGAEIGLPDLIDKRWIEGGYNTDLWTVEGNFTNKWLECQRMEQLLRGIASKGGQPKAPGSSMSHDEAMQLVADVLEQTKQAGYSKISATAYAQDGVWMIRVVWEDGSPIHGIKSREMWNKVFKDNVEMDLEDQMKGAK